MDAEVRQRTGGIYSATQRQTRKTRRIPGGAIINSKTKYARRYEFQDKMPSHGQHYLKDTSNLACFPYTHWKSKRAVAARYPSRHYDWPGDVMDRRPSIFKNILIPEPKSFTPIGSTFIKK